MKKSRRSVAVTIAALAISAGVGISTASPAQALEDWTWSTPADLSTADFGFENAPDVPIVIDSQGRMTAVWKTVDGNFYRMASRTSLNGVDWTEPEYVTPANKDVSDAVLAADNSGRVTAMWLDQSGNDPIIRSNTFDGDSWLPAVQVTPSEGRYENLAVVADSTGLLTAIWTNQGACSIDSSTSTDGQTWTVPVPVTTDSGRCPYAPQIVADASNRLTAIWNADDGQASQFIVVEASTSATPGSWSSAEVLSTVGEDARDMTLATTKGGLAVAAWKSEQGTGPTIKSRSSQNGASWSPLESHGSESSDYPGLYAGPSGTVLVSWRAGSGGSDGMLVTSSDDGVAWTSPVRISPAGDTPFEERAHFSEDSCGQIVATWSTLVESQQTFFVQSSTSVNGIDWSSPVNPASSADISFLTTLVEDSHGRVTAVWLALSGGTMLMQTSTMTKPACAAAPVLANTGADTTAIGVSLAVSAGLLAAGLLALAVMRRRQRIR